MGSRVCACAAQRFDAHALTESFQLAESLIAWLVAQDLLAALFAVDGRHRLGHLVLAAITTSRDQHAEHSVDGLALQSLRMSRVHDDGVCHDRLHPLVYARVHVVAEDCCADVMIHIAVPGLDVTQRRHRLARHVAVVDWNCVERRIGALVVYTAKNRKTVVLLLGALTVDIRVCGLRAPGRGQRRAQ